MNVLELVKKYAVLALILVFSAAACVVMVLRAHELKRQIAQHVEENVLHTDPALADAGVAVETTVPREWLERRLGDLTRANADLAAQLEAAKKAGGKVQTVTKYVTKVVTVHGDPIPNPSKACLVDDTSKMRLELDHVDLIADKGSRLHLLSISAWRTWPEPATKLFTDGLAIPETQSVGLGGTPLAPPDRKLSLSLRAGWVPDDLRARPELSLALGYRLLKLGRVALSPYAEVGQRYAVGGYDLHAAAGAELKLDVH